MAQEVNNTHQVEAASHVDLLESTPVLCEPFDPSWKSEGRFFLFS
ncbi:hypothetical protein [Rufibacter tibetensis]|nr:hypothetical protein [Rufibacter tibetensis]